MERIAASIIRFHLPFLFSITTFSVTACRSCFYTVFLLRFVCLQTEQRSIYLPNYNNILIGYCWLLLMSFRKQLHISASQKQHCSHIPSCFQSLLSLLRLGSGKGEGSYLHLQALSCLRQLCVGLRRRLRFHQDPSFYSTKQGSTPYGLC